MIMNWLELWNMEREPEMEELLRRKVSSLCFDLSDQKQYHHDFSVLLEMCSFQLL